jgi:multidrug resistance efflux pump
MPMLVFISVAAVVGVTWRQHVSMPRFIGEVENVRVNVISIQPGLLVELTVDVFEQVRKDQVIGRMYPTDPDALKASLAVIDTDLRLLRARMNVDERRNEMDYQRLRLDSLRYRTELAVARVNLQQAESELQRVTQLHEEKVESSALLDVARRDQERLRMEVAEKALLLADVEATLERLSPVLLAANPHIKTDLVITAIEAQENRLMLLEGPLDLRAPSDGTVSLINHRVGEKIMAGDPILTISMARPERIVGYARQPIKFIPKVGDSVQVRSRGSVRQVAMAKVVQVGGDMQTVAAPLQFRGFTTALESGLPFLVNLPEGMEVFPGELVDLVLLQ